MARHAPDLRRRRCHTPCLFGRPPLLTAGPLCPPRSALNKMISYISAKSATAVATSSVDGSSQEAVVA